MADKDQDTRKKHLSKKLPLQFPLSKELYERAKMELKKERDIEMEEEDQLNNDDRKDKMISVLDQIPHTPVYTGGQLMGINIKLKPVFINGFYSPGKNISR